MSHGGVFDTPTVTAGAYGQGTGPHLSRGQPGLVETTYVLPVRLGLGFTRRHPLRISSIDGVSEGRGLAVGMSLVAVNGEEVSKLTYEDAVQVLTSHCKLLHTQGKGVTLTFSEEVSEREF
jgi:hypothetical protein